MNCPKCEGKSRLISKKEVPGALVERRECLDCGRRFSVRVRIAKH